MQQFTTQKLKNYVIAISNYGRMHLPRLMKYCKKFIGKNKKCNKKIMIRIKMVIKITQTNKANKIMNSMRWNKKQAKSNKNK